MSDTIEIKCQDGLSLMKEVKDGSVDLILTDPPYIISKDNGMNNFYNAVKSNEDNNVG
jgi:site-specific DNA-methyltransferase (adenine-specific)